MLKVDSSKIILFLSLFIYLLPIALISGPAIPDIIISICGIIYLANIFLRKKKNINFNIFIIIIFIWCVYLIISSLISNNFLFSLENSLFFSRFFIFAFLISFIIQKNLNFLKIFTIILISTLVIVSFDSLLQFFYGYNSLGFFMPDDLSGKGRISGFFRGELILGSFLVRLFPLSIGLLIYNFSFARNFKIYLIFLIALFNISIFVSGERSALFYCILSNIIMLILVNRFNFQILISNSITLFIILFLTSYNLDLKNRIFSYTFNQLNILQITDDVKKIDNDTVELIFNKDPLLDNEKNTKNNYLFNNIIFFSEENEVFFYKSLKIFNSNKIFGIGPKMFRLECSKDSYLVDIHLLNAISEKKKMSHGCNTHPHNIYLQLFTETGIIGSVPVVLFFFYIIYSISLIFINNILLRKKNKHLDLEIFILISLLIPLWPLIPTGSFFNNWLNVINFLCLGFFIFIKTQKK